MKIWIAGIIVGIALLGLISLMVMYPPAVLILLAIVSPFTVAWAIFTLVEHYEGY